MSDESVYFVNTEELDRFTAEQRERVLRDLEQAHRSGRRSAQGFVDLPEGSLVIDQDNEHSRAQRPGVFLFANKYLIGQQPPTEKTSCPASTKLKPR